MLMKKISGIKKIMTVVSMCFAVTALIFANGCAESKKVAAKSGAQLWAENCQRCHNTPSPSAFAGEQWKTVGMHMQTRAMLTNNERDKIIDFMQSMNR